jgi:hypothetical protein
MLNRETRNEVQRGNLQLYPVRFFWESFEIATGIPLGIRNIHDKKFEQNSALSRIEKTLKALQKREDTQRDSKNKTA